MKNYTYNGEQASFAIRTPAGRLFLQKGLIVAVALAIHDAVIKNPIVQELVKTGEITVTDQFLPEEASVPQDDGVTPVEQPAQTETDATADDSKLTIPQIKKLLDEAGIEYPSGAKRDELEALLPK